ncbi:toll/interleukin-1 receptor domain-containing protein [Ochrobactrum sp. Marseille-Q0166]|uniref:toll/interleukin-1 receptor domain-containing protein n=1 Tax=Ochrobactrum sp. Marseille-Q0166 TaxID=2761105 RepID=UPI0032B58346
MEQWTRRNNAVLFFVSANSLKSKMVELEWQNALIAKAQSKLRFIPIRIDPSPLPPLLMQSFYLDLYTNGLDVVKRQIIDLAKRNDNFKPQHSNFSNIICSIHSSNNILTLNFEAKFYLEPVCEFAIYFKNSFDEFSYTVPNEAMFIDGTNPNVDTSLGKRNILVIGKHQSLAPKFPFKVVVTAKDKYIIHIDGIHHKISPTEWMSIPILSSPF